MKNVVIGLLGTSLDMGTKIERWNKWRPTISICQQEDFVVDRFELIHENRFHTLASTVTEDINTISPETRVSSHLVRIEDPWDFEEVYGVLHNFAVNYRFSDDENYFIHITTGTHVAQICLFLLTESRHLPGKLLQTAPGKKQNSIGKLAIIDLDLSRYNSLANRFEEEKQQHYEILKSGIKTKDANFNKLIESIEKISIRSTAPILLTGPTGAGKSQLAKKIYKLRQQRRLANDRFVEVNCATLRGDSAISTLFGHKKGAFTGAVNDRKGLLKEADGGLIFLDEIGELGLDEQAMLLRALEEHTFLPLGSDQEEHSHFQLICGTNANLRQRTAEGLFRDDLLARINIWTFELPSLKNRLLDIEPNIDYELSKVSTNTGKIIRFNSEARKKYLSFATNSTSLWKGNFRDLNASILRLSTMADSGRISTESVDEEISRLEADWHYGKEKQATVATKVLSEEVLQQIDPFDLPQLVFVIETCLNSNSLSDAGRSLFAISRVKRKATNDADRLRKYLSKFDLSWEIIQQSKQ
jgi:transcriptional regulatory protein RtcR